jgi:hypothetical protein
MKVFAQVILFMFCVSSLVFGHEGHDHDGPTTIQAPKGGVIKALDEARVEVVSKGKDIKIYFYNKDMSPAKVSDFKVVAKAELPRTKKVDSILLTPSENHFKAFYDAKGSHRYNLRLEIMDPRVDHLYKLNFTIEPKR